MLTMFMLNLPTYAIILMGVAFVGIAIYQILVKDSSTELLSRLRDLCSIRQIDEGALVAAMNYHYYKKLGQGPRERLEEFETWQLAEWYRQYGGVWKGADKLGHSKADIDNELTRKVLQQSANSGTLTAKVAKEMPCGYEPITDYKGYYNDDEHLSGDLTGTWLTLCGDVAVIESKILPTSNGEVWEGHIIQYLYEYPQKWLPNGNCLGNSIWNLRTHVSKLKGTNEPIE